jgi:hypothetical protein
MFCDLHPVISLLSIQIYHSMIAQELVNGKEIFVNLGLAEDRFDPSSVPIQF